MWGWAMFWTMHSGILAAIAMVFARYAGFFVPLDDTGSRLVAISAILILSAINYRGVTFGSRLQSAFTLVKVLAVLAIMVLGFALYDPGRRRRMAGDRGRRVVRQFPARRWRRPVRLRRLAHGDLHGGRDGQSDADHSARR